MVAQEPHKLRVVGSSPTPATNRIGPEQGLTLGSGSSPMTISVTLRVGEPHCLLEAMRPKSAEKEPIEADGSVSRS